jgi:hypothetical protein
MRHCRGLYFQDVFFSYFSEITTKKETFYWLVCYRYNLPGILLGPFLLLQLQGKKYRGLHNRCRTVIQIMTHHTTALTYIQTKILTRVIPPLLELGGVLYCLQAYIYARLLCTYFLPGKKHAASGDAGKSLGAAIMTLRQLSFMLSHSRKSAVVLEPVHVQLVPSSWIAAKLHSRCVEALGTR